MVKVGKWQQQGPWHWEVLSQCSKLYFIWLTVENSALGKDGGSSIGLFNMKSEGWVIVAVQTEHLAEKAVEGVSLSDLLSPTLA